MRTPIVSSERVNNQAVERPTPSCPSSVRIAIDAPDQLTSSAGKPAMTSL